MFAAQSQLTSLWRVRSRWAAMTPTRRWRACGIWHPCCGLAVSTASSRTQARPQHKIRSPASKMTTIYPSEVAPITKWSSVSPFLPNTNNRIFTCAAAGISGAASNGRALQGEPRAQLLPLPEQGCLLLAHPLMGGERSFEHILQCCSSLCSSFWRVCESS